MWILLNHLRLMMLSFLFLGGLAALSCSVDEENPQQQVAGHQEFARTSEDVFYVVQQISEPKLRKDARAAIRRAPVEDQEILTVIYSLCAESPLSFPSINAAALITSFDIVLSQYFSSIIKNVEKQNEVIAELGKPYTNLERLKTMLSSCFPKGERQTQVAAALHAQRTLIAVLVESWAWRRLICIDNDALREDAATAVCQEPAPTKLTVAWTWNYNFAKIADPQIRQEANGAVTRVSGHDKLWVAELWKTHLQTISGPTERTSTWCSILLFLQGTEVRSSFARRLEVLSMLGKGSPKPVLKRKKRRSKSDKDSRLF
jgi:hypothetical protein